MKFDAAVQMVQRLGQGALLAKADIKSTFRLLPVAKADFKIIGFKFKGKWFFDKAMPFGCSVSCATFERFANFLQWVVQQNCTAGEIEHYLDDFLFGGEKGTEQCNLMLQAFFDCCRNFGIPIADDKTEGPTTVLVFLGLVNDSVLMQIRIPQEKIQMMVQQIENILLHKHTATLKELQSLLGSLNFMCRAIVPGRPFCRRLINATCGVKRPHHHITLNKGIKHDLLLWLRFFREFNGVSIFNEKTWCYNADVCLFTDSSAAKGNGLGAYFQKQWTFAPWPVSWIEQGLLDDITLLEYFPILVSIYIWGDKLKNKKSFISM